MKFFKLFLVFLLLGVLLCVSSCEKKEEVEDSGVVVSKSLEGMPVLVGDIPCEFPLSESGRTLKIMAVPSSFGENYDEIFVWKKYEEMTGIDVLWTTMPRSDRSSEIKNALTKALEYDLIIRGRTSLGSLNSYGANGLILDLAKDDLLKNNAPNCWAYLQAHPDTLASIMNPDGSIYSLPQVNSGAELRVSRKIFINKQWLERTGMEIPTTTEELYNLLIAFRDQDANGNGDPNDEIPFCPVDWSSIQEAFFGAFGLANRGQHNQIVDKDPNGEGVRLIAASEQFKLFLQYLNKLFSESLMDKFVFTSSDSQEVKTQWQYNIQNDKIGVFAHTNLAEVPVNLADKWVAIEEALEGPEGDKLWAPVRANFHSVGATCIPATCSDPALVLRWLDYFWTDEGTLFYHMGIEGETFYKTENGTFDYMPFIYEEAQTEGISFDEVAVRYTPYPGGGNPTVEIAPYFMGGEMAPVPAAAARALFEYGPEEYWPSFNFTAEENSELSPISSDIGKYCNAARNSFIMGSKPFSEWDSYVQQLQDMGMQKMLDIYQNAVDRYNLLKESSY